MDPRITGKVYRVVLHLRVTVAASITGKVVDKEVVEWEDRNSVSLKVSLSY